MKTESKKIFSLYYFQQTVSIAKLWNGFYYFLRRMPFVGKKLPIKFYRSYGLKEVLNIFGLVLKFLFAPLKKALAIGVVFLIGAFVVAGFNLSNIQGLRIEYLELGLMIWLIISFLGVGGMRYLVSLSQEQTDLLFSFHLPRKEFVYSQIYVDFGINVLFYMIVFGILLLVTSISPLILLNALLGYISFYFLAEALQRLKIIFNPSKKKKRIIGWTVVILYLLVSVVSVLFYYFEMENVLNNYFVTFIFLFTLSFCYLVKRKSNEEKYLFYLVTDGASTIEQAAETQADEYFINATTLEKGLHYSSEEDEHLNEKNALDQLLFKRYRKSLINGLYLRVGVLAIIGVMFLAMAYFSDEKMKENDILGWLPFVFFALYLVSYGKKIVQISFMNCDSSMLFYPFYRKKEVILSGLFYRLKMAFLYNSVCSLEIFLIFVGLIVISQPNHALYVTFLSFLTIFSLNLFFSFHELFIYYLLQPFTSSLKVVNPLYKTLSGAVYVVAYFQTQIANDIDKYVQFYALTVSIIAILYVSIGAFVIYKKAPQTFRIKD